MGAEVIDLDIIRGKTFEQAYRYSTTHFRYPPITGMPTRIPVRLTVPGHGIPDGWAFRVIDVRQPVELNSKPGQSYIADVIDSSTIEINKLTAGTDWRPFVASGAIAFKQPFDLTGCSARMQVRDRIDGTVLLTFNTDPTTSPDGTIEIDVALASIILRLSPQKTAAIEWSRGVYDLELITPEGNVYPVTAPSKVTVSAEVTK